MEEGDFEDDDDEEDDDVSEDREDDDESDEEVCSYTQSRFRRRLTPGSGR